MHFLRIYWKRWENSVSFSLALMQKSICWQYVFSITLVPFLSYSFHFLQFAPLYFFLYAFLLPTVISTIFLSISGLNSLPFLFVLLSPILPLTVLLVLLLYFLLHIFRYFGGTNHWFLNLWMMIFRSRQKKIKVSETTRGNKNNLKMKSGQHETFDLFLFYSLHNKF